MPPSRERETLREIRDAGVTLGRLARHLCNTRIRRDGLLLESRVGAANLRAPELVARAPSIVCTQRMRD